VKGLKQWDGETVKLMLTCEYPWIMVYTEHISPISPMFD